MRNEHRYNPDNIPQDFRSFAVKIWKKNSVIRNILYSLTYHFFQETRTTIFLDIIMRF